MEASDPNIADAAHRGKDAVNQPAPPQEPIVPTALLKSPSVPTRESDLPTEPANSRLPGLRHLARTVFEFFAQWQHAIVTDEHAQKAFAAELGFCPLHLWQLAALSSPLGASVGWAKLAEQLSQAVTRAATSPSAAKDASALVRRSADCRVCRLLCETEKKYVQWFAAALREPQNCEAYARSQGACLRRVGSLEHASCPSRGTPQVGGRRQQHEAARLRRDGKVSARVTACESCSARPIPPKRPNRGNDSAASCHRVGLGKNLIRGKHFSARAPSVTMAV